MPLLPLRPDISIVEILLYAFGTFIIALLLTKPFLVVVQKYKLGKKLRVEAVDGGSSSVFLTYHQSKVGTPTMGGILIWGAVSLMVLLTRMLSHEGIVEHSLLQRGQVYIPLAVLIGFGILGAIDDFMNIRGIGRNKGLAAAPKLIILLVMSGIAVWWFYARLGYQSIHLPFGNMIGINEGFLDIGAWYIPFFLFVVIGTANAVNVTDGLDGLAGGLLIIAFSSLAVIAYLTQLSALAAFCAVIVGALAAFLWHNVPPAAFFMGDTGSLALGGTLAVTAFMIGEVLVLPLIGFVFMLEMSSVIIQLLSKKFLKKKVFHSAPFHHHLEALNWGESKVTMRLWIIGAFTAFLGILVGVYG